MPGNPVAEVDAPRQTRHIAVGLICQAGHETSDSTDGNSRRQGNSEQIPSGRSHAEALLHQLNGD